MKINEIFESLQGEGEYIGYPVLFIRMSGCNRNCAFCDTKYHINFKNYSIDDVVDIIRKSKKKIVVWTGGEPLLQVYDIKTIVMETLEKKHHLETNGDLAGSLKRYLPTFDYICCSPKSKKTAEFLYQKNYCHDIKVVTDLELNKELIPYATSLMPLTTGKPEEDEEIRKRVWEFCNKNNIKYTPRVHYEVWGSKRGV